MGKEYSVTSKEFDLECMGRLIEKATCTYREFIYPVSSEEFELRFSLNCAMPDATIYIEKSGILFLYNSGHEKSWAVFGLLVACMSEYFNGVEVSEL